MESLEQHVFNLIGLRLNREQLNALEQYERELLDWNSRFNLTAIRDSQGIQVKHFLDSLTCFLAFKDSMGGKVIDIGTGAGFPGIPIKIVFPQLEVTLVESIGKKSDFCRHMIKLLDLDGIHVIQERAEILGQSPAYREKYDWAVARAVAILPTLSEYLLPFVQVGGRVLAMKGESGPAEAQSAEKAIHLLGGHLKQIIPITLPGVVEERYLVVIDKIAATPDVYPRRVGIAQKNPI